MKTIYVLGLENLKIGDNNVRFINNKWISCNPKSKREIKQVNIGIKDGIITYLGNEIIPSNQLINAEEYILLPAFLNAHIHFGEYF